MSLNSSMTRLLAAYLKSKPEQANDTGNQTAIEAIQPLSLKAEAQINVRDEAIFHKYAIIVEGDTDKRVYERFLDSGTKHQVLRIYEIEPEGNFARQAVINFVRRGGEVKDYTQILGIVDSDFARVRGCRGPVKADQILLSQNERIFTTDMHDLETMIMSSDDFADLLKREMKRTWRTTLGMKAQKERKKLLEDALPLGYVSYLSRSSNQWNGITTELKRTKVEIFYHNGQVSLKKLADFVAAFTGNRAKSEEIKTQLEKCMNGHHSEDDWQICNGHVCVNILCYRLHEAIPYRVRLWDTIIRENYGIESFKRTELYEAIKEFVKRNHWKSVFR